ncbi:thiosulfate oxidation carrier protein SoxY [Azonexus hydrophilus]|uniref:Thiosulfate oxidation carrier protein SoxY n=1 Tax=Azonexus hydrophilus TaxID=418702 RepID=A0A1R1I5E3_9RHOO|nr:thiosulfate oxidation carrier protein SoxY [Azonexus hydrophilus]
MELRRKFLKGGASAALLAPLLGTGLLVPGRAWAANEWKRNAFTARSSADALKNLGIAAAMESRDVVINAPEIAENGAKVEVEISSKLPNTRSLLLLADKNPMPLCAEINFAGAALPYAKVQLKMAETMRIRAIVRTADGKTHVAFREIKVTLGGCGG